MTGSDAACPGPRDHGGVIGAKAWRRRMERVAERLAFAEERISQSPVCGDAARRHKPFRQAFRIVEPEGGAEPVSKGFSRGSLEGGAEVRDILAAERRMGQRRLSYGCLQPGKREIGTLTAHERPWQGEPAWIAVRRRALNSRAAGKSEAQHLGDLIEGFAQRIVDCAAELLIVEMRPYPQELGMPSRNKKKKIGRMQTLRQPDRQGMAFEVIDGGERQITDERNRLRRYKPRQHTADKARTSRGGDALQVAKPKAGFGERSLDQRIEHLNVSAGRNLRHDTAIGRVILELRSHNIGKDNAISLEVAPYNCGGSFIAACLNTEYG